MVRRDICWGVDTYWKICVRGKGRGAGGELGPVFQVGKWERRKRGVIKTNGLGGGGEEGRGGGGREGGRGEG